MDSKVGIQKVTWGTPDTFEYTLTTSYVASDPITVDFAKRLTLYGYYKGGSGSSTNTVSIYIEANPFDATEDASGAFWSQVGIYNDTAGTWAQEAAVFTATQTTAGTYKNEVPIDFTNVNAKRIRLVVKENVGAGSAGTAKFVIAKNDIF